MLDPKLDTLLLVAEKRNFTRAAQALSLTQPAVSHHISQLEQELGVRLFVRGNGDLMLTPEGGDCAAVCAPDEGAVKEDGGGTAGGGTAAHPAAHRHHPHGGEQYCGRGTGPLHQ